ncbi:STAS domain-containing protein [Gordonia sp. DT30]
MNQLDTQISYHPLPEARNPLAQRYSTESSMGVGRSFCVQQLSGAIDMQTTADFAAALDRVLGRAPEAVVLDMSQVEFVSASGLGILVNFCDEAARLSVPVAVVCSRAIDRPVRACPVDIPIDIHGSVESAGWAVITSAVSH